MGVTNIIQAKCPCNIALDAEAKARSKYGSQSHGVGLCTISYGTALSPWGLQETVHLLWCVLALAKAKDFTSKTIS